MQPVSRIFTTESGVEARENREAVQYLESFLPAYCVLDRKVFNQLLQPNYRERFPKDSDYVKALIKEENIYKRTANSIVRDMNGRIRALKELKKTEIQDMEVKLAKKQDKLKKLDKRIKTLKNKARKNTATQEELEELRWKKQSRYHTKNQINELKQKIQELKEEVAGNRKLSMGFGTRKKFRSQNHLQENHYGTHEDWYEDFVQSRDKNIYYVGTNSESNGNLMAQLTYMEESDSFRLQLTKEKYWQKNKEDQYVFIDGLKFSNLHASGKEAHPVSIHILRRNGRWYVQAMIHIDSSEKWTTSSFYGTIGLDFNNGFIEASRTNQYGKLVEQRHY